ncbi:MAG TPA: AAA family ATPase [Geobacteraceae bacterium]|jgi:type II secretory pathway predicted ATPase ExeA|nr:AAA family ATPase [Geobacteraceae bacterium]
MFRRFYGLREKPFSKTPDPRFLYLSRWHQEALARLQYAVEEREPALLTGAIGSGKTTISRALMDSLDDSYRFCFIFNPVLTPLEFLRVVARNLGLENPAGCKDDLLKEITGELYNCHNEGGCPVIVIDEAQLIPGREVFDEIRLLTNFQLDDKNLLSMIIMGQPEVRKKLAHPVFEPLRQRIGIQYHLAPLDLEETMEYMDFRIKVAGGKPGLFSPEAIQMIHELSGGVPRRINAIATNALLVGYGKDAAWIDDAVIEEVRNELTI